MKALSGPRCADPHLPLPLPPRPQQLLLPPRPQLLPPSPSWLPLLPLRAVLSWVPSLQPLPRGDTTLGLAPLHPLRHILGHPGGPHRPRGPGPQVQGSPPTLSLISHNRHSIRALLEPLLWTCPQLPSSGGHSSTTTLFQGMLIAVRGTCMMRFFRSSLLFRRPGAPRFDAPSAEVLPGAVHGTP